MRKDNKIVLALVSLFTILITGCGSTNTSTSSNKTSSNVSTSLKDNTSSSTNSTSSLITNSSNGSASSSITSSNHSSDSISTSILDAEVYITNKAELTKTWTLNSGDRMIGIAANEGINANLAVESNEITITSNNEDVLKVYGLYLHPVAAGEATITVRYHNAFDTVDIAIEAVESSAPRLFLDYDGFTTYKSLQGNPVVIPNFICIDKNNQDITSNVIVTSDLDSNAVYDAANGTFTSTIVGEHTITYTAVDSEDSTLKTEKSIKLNIYRKMFSWTDNTFTVHNEYSNNQTVTSNKNGFQLARFNINPGTIYYAEADVSVSANNNTYKVGMGHYKEGSVNYLTSVINSGDSNFNMKDFKTSGDDSWTFENGPFSWQLGTYRVPEIGHNWKNIKFAIARDGDNFYTFINDHLVSTYAGGFYAEGNTIPAIVGHDFVNPSTEYSNIDFYNDETKVREKISTLIANDSAYVMGYNQYSGYGATEGTDFIVNPISEERGVNFDFIKDNIENSDDNTLTTVSPYVYFSDDFTFEFDYKFTSTANTGDWGRMWIEARSALYNWAVPWFEFGAVYSGSNQRFLMDQEKAKNEGWTTSAYYTQPQFADTSKWGGVAFDESKGVHYKITRDLQESQHVFTLELYSIANPDQKYTQTVTANTGNWNKEITLTWRNINCAGQFSNIKWSTGGEN